MRARVLVEYPSRGRRWATRGAVALLAIGIGAVAFWPLRVELGRWLEAALSDRQPVPATATAPSPSTTTVPAPPPPEPSLVGTDSSIAADPRPLILTGTQLGRTPDASVAFLGTHAEQPQTYASGAVLANGARIAVIGRDHVVLEQDGQQVELHIGGALRRAGASLSGSDLAVVGARAESPLPPPSADALSGVLRVMPHYRDGLLQGFVAAAGTERARFEAWGLKDGDLITTIDGLLPADAEQATFMLAGATDGVATRVTVQRGAERLQLTLDPAVVVAPPPAPPPPPLS